MTPLRQQMIDAMLQCDLSIATLKSYLYAVSGLARYFNQSPEHLRQGQIQGYFNYLVRERNLSAASCRQHLNTIRFLYLSWLTFMCPLFETYTSWS